MITDCLQKGFNLANRNVQLVLLRMAVSIFKMLALALFMAVPLVLAVLFLGVDIAQARDVLPFLSGSPYDFIARHPGPFFLVAAALCMYALFSFLVTVYVMAGTLGILKSSADDKGYRFSMGDFFRNATAGFSRLFWLLTLLSGGGTLLILFFILAGGLLAAVYQGIGAPQGMIALFFTSFVFISAGMLGSIIIAGACALSVYAVLVLVVDGAGGMQSVKQAFAFMKSRPRAFWFVMVVLALSFAAYGVLVTIQISLHIVPFIIPLLYVANAFFQNYIIVFAWSSLLASYEDRGSGEAVSSAYEI